MTIRKINPDDILRWPDGTWCYRGNHGEYGWMSDDYEVLTPEHPEYKLLQEEAA